MRLRGLACLCLALFVVLSSPARPALAQTGFEQLASPGPLAHHHAQLEKSCTSCHKPLDRAAQKDQCLTCHKEIQEDLTESRGMHGLSTEVQGSQCNRCHTEHKGRERSLVEIDPLTFDHMLTNFPLTGAHRTEQCVSCHKERATSPTTRKIQYKGTPSACLTCHQKDDVHKGRLGPGCSDCHTDVAWSDRSKPFDHFQLSGFRLVDAHRLVAEGGKTTCASCHFGERYKGIPHETCAACHGLEDAHKGLFGAQCGLCHNQKAWKQVTGARGRPNAGTPTLAQAIATLKAARFDHDRTHFPLVGNHTKAECASCHKTTFKGTRSNCHACHAKEDHHKGRFGTKCETCHSPVGWKKIVGTKGEANSLAATIRVLKEARFDHAKTNFPLVGHHQKAECGKCHKTTFKDTPRYCHACHARDDAHKGAFGTRCEACHSPTGWKAIGRAGGGATSIEAAMKALKAARFDHGKTRFSLTGRHSRTSCESCHVNKNKSVGAEPRFRGTPRACIDCHRSEGRRAHGTSSRYNNCARCHSTRGW